MELEKLVDSTGKVFWGPRIQENTLRNADGTPYQAGYDASMSKQELIEQLADKEHASWAKWMDYLFSRCPFTEKGDAIIPRELVTHWKRQAATPYAQLSEREKQSDREEVAHILPIIEEYSSQTVNRHI